MSMEFLFNLVQFSSILFDIKWKMWKIRAFLGEYFHRTWLHPALQPSTMTARRAALGAIAVGILAFVALVGATDLVDGVTMVKARDRSHPRRLPQLSMITVVFKHEYS